MKATSNACLALGVAALFSASCEKGGESGAGSEAEGSEAKKSAAAPAADEAKAAAQPEKMALPPTKEGQVRCTGINECKGKGGCHGLKTHSCAGQNACKGKGWIEVPQAECESRGGEILES